MYDASLAHFRKCQEHKFAAEEIQDLLPDVRTLDELLLFSQRLLYFLGSLGAIAKGIKPLQSRFMTENYIAEPQ